ncbi:MAG: DNRLRE domain-containing protein [Limnohabitans sp.]|nr:DNRLRE domain-containing protein [Limnohabitans sp.]
MTEPHFWRVERRSVRAAEIAAFGITIFSIGVSEVQAGLLALAATRDAAIYQSSDGSIANGAGRYLFAGKTNQNLARRSLLHFDVASALPNGAEITAVRLTLNLSQVNGGSGARDVSLHLALSPWTTGASNPADTESLGGPALAGDCTWLHANADGIGGGTLWETAGGDFAAFASASVTTQAVGLYTWSSLGLLNDVRLFAADPSRNNGWFLLGDESAAGTARRFDSADSATEGGVVPVLEIEYSIVPAPGPVALLALAALLAPRRKRRV